MQKPESNEHRPYFKNYLNLVPDGDFFQLFDQNTDEVARFYSSIDKSKHEYRYAENKWTPKQVLLHVCDTDRIFSYRAFVCIRGDGNTLLKPLNENAYAANADGSNRSMDSIVAEFKAVRAGMRHLLENASEEQSKFLGNNDGFKVSARALGYITIGHAIHHMNIIKERYLGLGG
ncbi:MAG: DinB family protein [Candidatus Kapabacteria bacterium]|nr:DinB family protein [Candidatus Kapabacteria bacterium]